ncbi:hypothetical protein, partial [Vreelandella titanicae]|uniref:hypothetical protein n=1 Tax=Vreelandella titanicae TaxID=664683 RepID=UPI001C6FCACC
WQEAVQGLAGVIETSPGREVGQLRLGMNAYVRMARQALGTTRKPTPAVRLSTRRALPTAQRL